MIYLVEEPYSTYIAFLNFETVAIYVRNLGYKYEYDDNFLPSEITIWRKEKDIIRVIPIKLIGN